MNEKYQNLGKIICGGITAVAGAAALPIALPLLGFSGIYIYDYESCLSHWKVIKELIDKLTLRWSTRGQAGSSVSNTPVRLGNRA